MLELTKEADKLAKEYLKAIDIPDKAEADAYHLAIAVNNGMDYLITWNCTHIASGRVRKIVERINMKYGITTPVICTPEELMEV